VSVDRNLKILAHDLKNCVSMLDAARIANPARRREIIEAVDKILLHTYGHMNEALKITKLRPKITLMNNDKN
jgi:hypothetical protein